MSEYGHITLMIGLVAIYITTIALVVIVSKNRIISDILIFIGFLVYSIQLTMQHFFGPKYDLNENGVGVRQEGFLSMDMLLVLDLMTTVFIAIGFTIKAFQFIKK